MQHKRSHVPVFSLALIASLAMGCSDPVEEPVEEVDARIDPGATIYIMSANGTPGFYAYSTGLDTWTTLPEPPVATQAQITSDDQLVYMMGIDNTIYSYDPATREWAAVQPGPGAEATVAPISYFEWTAQGFFHIQLNSSVLKRSDDKQTWNEYLLPRSGSPAGDYDPMRNRLYIKVGNDLGIMVWDLINNEVLDDFYADQLGLEDSRAGSVLDGYFYTRNYAEPLLRIDVDTGVSSIMQVNPSEEHASTIADRRMGRLYFGPHQPTGTTFEVWTPELNELKELAPLPGILDDHTTMAIIH